MSKRSLKLCCLLLMIFQIFQTGLGNWVEPQAYKSCPHQGILNISFRNYCEIYNTCENGNSRLESCPDGLYFHAAKGLCDFPRNVKGCEPMDSFAPTTAKPSRQIVDVIQQNFDCDPVDVIVKRRGKRRCKVQVICSNGISFVLKRCMQTISLRI
ncbi:uncharacterized protein LOC110844926 [Folsomia candida]|uniref:Chondroitin proteoglycan 2 n=1 Tax=Folsomia candida TaxID=158441 RepID=A0A226EP95_FOLCA|nr:uncharacterized protein LOC110844926 [Folsomia candida]OXA59028.1 Chondroitin proteoglycan 2 [Folsomia candida]